MTTCGAVERSEPPALTGMLGVLGGMGPLATAYFYQRVVEATPSSHDQDHLPVVIWGDPTVPDRSAALVRRDAANPGPWLLRGARALRAMGAELIAVPCNSAHPFLCDVRLAIDVPVVDMVKVTVEAAAHRVGPSERVVVLCTEGTYQAGIYQRQLRSAALEPVDLAPVVRRRVQAAISEIKAGRVSTARSMMREVLADLAPDHPDAVITGCTELTTIRDDLADVGWPIIDSASALATSSVSTLRGLQ